jgi:SAM-dependent methyltransferase
VDDGSIDVIISFYSMEHMYPIENYLKEFRRVLRPGGLLVGAIPCEGGLAWGAGKVYHFPAIHQKELKDPDKIICCEHANFAERFIQSLTCHFELILINLLPRVTYSF